MGFQVGDKVRFTEDTNMGLFGNENRGKVGTVVHVRDNIYGYPYGVRIEGEPLTEVFGEAELLEVVEVPDVEPDTTSVPNLDYTLGYADGYRESGVPPQFVLERSFSEYPEEDYRKGYVAGVLHYLDTRRAAFLAAVEGVAATATKP